MLTLWWCQQPAREVGVFVVVLCWCQHPARELVLVLQDCGFVVVFLGGGRVVVFLCWCFWCFCGGGVFVVFLWCQHPARELILFGVLRDCGFVVVFLVFLWWCQHPARELVLFGVLQDCGRTWCFSRQLLADNLICSGPCFHDP